MHYWGDKQINPGLWPQSTQWRGGPGRVWGIKPPIKPGIERENILQGRHQGQQSRIRETKNLSTKMNSSTSTKKSGSVRQNLPKNYFFLRGDFTPFISKSFQIGNHFLPLLFPNDSKSLKSLNIRLREVGATRHLNGTLKINRRTDRRTHGRTFQLIERIDPQGKFF